MKKRIGKILEIVNKKKLTKDDLNFIIAMNHEEYKEYCRLKRKKAKTG